MIDRDIDLVNDLREGKLCAVQHLVSRKYQRLTGLMHVLLGHSASAEALTQHALRKAVDEIGSYSIKKGLFDTWLHSICIGVWMEANIAPPETNTFINEVHGLPEFEKACLCLSQFQALDSREIALALSSKSKKVEKALKQARQGLTRYLNTQTASKMNALNSSELNVV